jgi:hypothetical protein
MNGLASGVHVPMVGLGVEVVYGGVVFLGFILAHRSLPGIGRCGLRICE